MALAVRVGAAPSEGAANEAVLKLITRTLDLPPRSASLVSGASARLKHVRLEGPAEMILARPVALAGSGKGCRRNTATARPRPQAGRPRWRTRSERRGVVKEGVSAGRRGRST